VMQRVNLLLACLCLISAAVLAAPWSAAAGTATARRQPAPPAPARPGFATRAGVAQAQVRPGKIPCLRQGAGDPTLTSTPALGWEGHIVSITPWATNWSGSILRVHVVGRPGVLIEVTWSDQLISAFSGSKKEYGPYAAEFAPLPSGTYTVSVPQLDASLEISVDATSLIVVEFTQTRPLNATSTPMPGTPTATPLPGWEGRVLGITYKDLVGSILWVKVVGKKGLYVTVSTPEGFTTSATTGTKKELGDDVAEFAPLSKGTYTISPAGLGVSLVVSLDGSNIWSVEFHPTAGTPVPTLGRIIGAGARPYRLSAVATATPTLTLTPTPQVQEEASPSPTPAPHYIWQGRIVRQDAPPAGAYLGAIAVRVAGVKGQTVELSSGGWQARGITGNKPEYGEYATEFGGLHGGTYYVALPGVEYEPLAVNLAGGGFALVEFTYQPAPAPTPISTIIPGTWTGGVTSNTSSPAPAGGVWSNIIVKVGNVKGLRVFLRSGTFETSCLTGTKPEYGEAACEFGGLWPGTYQVVPEGLGPSVSLFMDGRGTAVVEFWMQ
jgi:hypothetical protein